MILRYKHGARYHTTRICIISRGQTEHVVPRDHHLKLFFRVSCTAICIEKSLSFPANFEGRRRPASRSTDVYIGKPKPGAHISDGDHRQNERPDQTRLGINIYRSFERHVVLVEMSLACVRTSPTRILLDAKNPTDTTRKER